MRAAILAVGSELLAPGKVDSNGSYLTEKLSELGIPVVFRAVVPDDEAAIESATVHALSRAGLLIVTGGLGPTTDDVTREAVSRALSKNMKLDSSILQGIQKRFERRGWRMPEVNRKQAMVPEGAFVLDNPLGTAPGLWLDSEERHVVLLPGPPVELRAVLERHVLPRIGAFTGDVFFRTKKLHVVGLAESAVEEKIATTYRRVDNPDTTILASAGQVEIRLTASGRTAGQADERNERLAKELRRRLGSAIFTETEERLEEVVGRLLSRVGLTIAVAESITGGLIAHRITEVAGSSRYFERAFVTYSNESKTEMLGVPPKLFDTVGAVSEEVARAMATGARARARSDIAVAVTGIAGPTGDTPSKPRGLVYVALATGDGVRCDRFVFPGNRGQVKRWTSQAALDMVRRELLDG